MNCEKCGQDFKNNAGIAAHKRFKHPPQSDPKPGPFEPPRDEVVEFLADVPAEVAEVINTPPPASPVPKLRDLGMRESEREDNWALRGKKVIKPACVRLDDKGEETTGPCPEQFGVEWYLQCPHDPWYRNWTETTSMPIYGDPDAQGDREILGSKERRVAHRELRLAEIGVSDSLNNGMSYEVALAHGARPVTDFGLLPFCEFWQCWSQKTQQFANGWFHSERHARRVQLVEQGEALLVATPTDALSAQKKEQQLRAVAV